MAKATKSDEPPRFDPWDIDLEQAVLGAILVDNRLIDVAAAGMDPEDFYDPMHSRLFEMAVYLQTEGPVNPVVLAAVMKTDPGLAEVGGVSYLAGLAAAAPALPPIKQYCGILKDLSGRRQMMALADELIQNACRPSRDAPTAALAEKATDGLNKILSGTKEGKRRRSVSATDATNEMLRRIEEQAVAEKPHGARTRLNAFDNVLGAVLPGKLMILAGRPGMGKSIVATNIGRNVADQIPVDYLSGEMDNDELSARVGCEIDFDRCAADALKPMAYGDFGNQRATGEMVIRMAEANIKLRELDFEFFDVSSMTLEWIEATCRRRSREKPGHRLVIIDHLQLVDLADPRRGANRNEIQTVITKRLKGLAKELGITILVLSQLSRDVEKRDDKHPMLADLREGGSIEQDADVVIGILRPLVYARAKLQAARNEEQRHKAILEYDEAKGVLEAAFLKNRGGRATDYFKLFIDEKASAVRDSAPDKGVQPGLDFAKLAEDMRA